MSQEFGFVRRIKRIQQNLDVRKTRAAIIQDYDFMVTPTCPPSTSVKVLAGKAWRNAGTWGLQLYNVQKPANTLDLVSDELTQYVSPVETTVLSLNFVLAYSYIAITIGYDADWIFYEQEGDGAYEYQWRYLLGSTEHTTAASAEAEIDALLNGGTVADYVGPYCSNTGAAAQFLLWSLVLRNNGVTGQDGQILPIDRLNRGRSYLYRDMRPGKSWILG